MSNSSKQGGWTFSKSGDNQSLLTAFRADDTLVQMIPIFEWPHKISLQSSSSSSSSMLFGPFQPNMPSVVPLWLALHLQTKSLCRIIPPHWLNTDNLRQILAFEKSNAQLWPPSPAVENDNDEEAQQQLHVYEQQKLLLPRNYYEVATRLAVTCEDCGAVKLLVTDLLQVRLDKLRQQFQSLLSEQSNAGAGTVGGLIVSIAGIGTAEVACLRETVQQTLNDKEFLQKKTESKSSTSSSSNNNKSTQSNRSSSMRTEGVDGNEDEDDDAVQGGGRVSSSPTTAAASSTTTTPGIVPGGRKPIRRFRGSIGRNNNNNKTITPGTT